MDTVAAELRLPDAGDLEFLWRLHRETMKDYVDQTWGWNETWQREYFDRHFDSILDPGLAQIIQIGGQPIGFISVRRTGNEIFLGAIEIATEFQNRGIGSGLIKRLLAESDRQRIPVRLSVLKVNPAQKLYQRLGFERIEETATHFVMQRRPV